MFRNLVDHPWVLVILVVLIIALFGSKRLPDAARGLGRSMRIFKSEVKEMKRDGDDASAAKSSEPTQIESKIAAERAQEQNVSGEQHTRTS